jgi:glycosyltransferase involved in cell wall biosynthesis
MKILTICPAHLKAYKIGGPIATVESMNKGLINTDKKIKIDVLSTSYGLDDASEIIYDEWESVDNMENYNVKYFNFYGYGSLTFSPRLFLEAKKIIKNYDILILQGVWNFPFFSAAYLARKNNIPYVVIPHGTLYKETWILKSKYYKYILYYFTVKNMLLYADKIQFTTVDERDNVLNFLGLNLENYIIPNSIDTSSFSPLPEAGSFKNKYPILKNKKLLLFFGRITRKKGLDILVDALKCLKAIRNDFVLIIAGPDSEGYFSVIEKYISDNDLNENVLYVGMIDGEEKISVLCDSDLFILSSYSENFGMAVIEAMTVGLPVVISNKVGIFNEVKKEKAGIVTSLDPIEIANEINTLFLSDNRIQYYAKKGPRFVEEYYEIRKVNQELLIELENIINEHE